MTHRNLPQTTRRLLTTAAIALSLFVGILVSDTAQAQVVAPARPGALARPADKLLAGGLLTADSNTVVEREVATHAAP